MFDVFGKSDPLIDQLTEAWLKSAPGDPNALVARSKYLLAMGWNYRGEELAYRVPKKNMRAMRKMHDEAFALAEQAVSLAPDMAAASDMVINTALTTGNRDKGFAEFQRFMSLHANRRTLILEAFTLSPQWGGGMQYIDGLCTTYAPQISSVPDYSSEICIADAVYYAYFPDGPDKEAALNVLISSKNPILDHARERAAREGQGPALWRLGILSKIRETRALDEEELSSYVNLLADRPGPWLRVSPAEPEAIDLARDLAPPDPSAGFPKDPFAKERNAHLQSLKLKADRDPLNPKIVTAYVKAVRAQSFGTLGPDANADLRKRIKRLLAVLPYNAALWHELSALMIEGDPTLDQIDAAGRAADNAFFYSGLLPESLADAIFVRLSQVMRLNYRPELKIPEKQDAETVARRDKAINCPLLRDLRLAMAICPDPMHFGKQCLRGGMMDLPMGTLMAYLKEAAARSGCQAGEAPINLLLPQHPASFDLASD